MPIPATVARANRRITNVIARRFAGSVPPFAIIQHHGRRSGATHRTPIMVFRSRHGFDIALTYGPSADWVRNVLAAGGCTLEYGRKQTELSDPEVQTDLQHQLSFPTVVRIALRLMRANEYLRLYTDRGTGGNGDQLPGSGTTDVELSGPESTNTR